MDNDKVYCLAWRAVRLSLAVVVVTSDYLGGWIWGTLSHVTLCEHDVLEVIIVYQGEVFWVWSFIAGIFDGWDLPNTQNICEALVLSCTTTWIFFKGSKYFNSYVCLPANASELIFLPPKHFSTYFAFFCSWFFLWILLKAASNKPYHMPEF